MIAEFEIGFVPTGWTRGAPLRIIQPIPNGWGCVRLDFNFVMLGSIATDDVAEVRFFDNVDDCTKVNRWLNWWRSENSMQLAS